MNNNATNPGTPPAEAPVIGEPAPELVVECWVQGDAVSLNDLLGKVVLIEVFQINCTGCFVHALPEVLGFHQQYAADGLSVIGLATAFEDYDINTLDNLRHVLASGEPVGEPKRQLDKAGFLEDGRLPYQLPFAIAMDRLVANTAEVSDESIERFIHEQIPDYHRLDYSGEQKATIYQRARDYLLSKRWCPQTFERYRLQGTPSSILVDRQGRLQDVRFGQVNTLKTKIETLLAA